jgi:hypothetical protein
MKRLLLAGLGMLLLGTAGLLILHQTVDTPPPARAQPPGVVPAFQADPAAFAEEGRRPFVAGRYKDLVPALRDALADPEGGVRQLAAATLARIGPDAVTPLVEALRAKDKETRANAAYVLGHMGEPAQEALPALAKALKDEDKDVRRRAAYAIHLVVTRVGSSAVPEGQAAGAPGAAVPPGGTGLGLAGGPPAMPGMGALLDPGLLLPSGNPPAKLETK